MKEVIVTVAMIATPIVYACAYAAYACLRSRIDPVARRLWRALETPVVLPPSAAGAWRRVSCEAYRCVGRLRRAVKAVAVARSERLFAREVARRSAAEGVYSGYTQYEEWLSELDLIEDRETRRFIRAQIDRYVPSERLVRRARRMAGRPCAGVGMREWVRGRV